MEKPYTGGLNGSTLAYLGDAVIELLVRHHLTKSTSAKLGKLNSLADELVNATTQSKAADKLLPHLTEDETAAFKLGKNVKVNNIPRHSTLSEYKKATALEALFAFVYLSGDQSRLTELFELAFLD